MTSPKKEIVYNNQKLIMNIIKISFIYSMIKDGWKFTCISDSVFEFKKSRALVNDIDIVLLLNEHLNNAF